MQEIYTRSSDCHRE